MQEPGHIYVLVNPSIDGLVKIGKSTRDPESRAKELSQATGVATPFYVAFSICVSDCDAAEKFVHAILDHKGFRHATNREFFQIPLREAIDILMLAERKMAMNGGTSDENAPESTSENTSENPGRYVFEQAIKTYYGMGDEIEDKEEGVRLLRRAMALNFPAAYTSLAKHFFNQAFNARFAGPDWNRQTYATTNEMGLAVLKQGAQKGMGRCWVDIASWYLLGDRAAERKPDPINAEKCWKKYFQSETFFEDNDIQLEDENWVIEFFVGDPFDDIVGLGNSRISNVYFYLKNVAQGNLPINSEILKVLNPLKDEVIELNNWLTSDSAEKALIHDFVQRML